MRSSESVDQLMPALIKARESFDVLAKGNTAKVESAKGGYSYKYADLPDLLDATVPALLKNQLMLTQAPDVDEQGFCLVTRLWHASGQFLESRFPLKHYDRAQEQGSAITYARRYAAQAMLGIAAEEDDDGAAAHAADKPGKAVGMAWLVAAKIDTVTAKPTGKPNVTKHTAKLSTGESVTTISEKLGKALAAAQGDGVEYQLDLVQTQWGVDVKSLKPMPPPASPVAHLAAPVEAGAF